MCGEVKYHMVEFGESEFVSKILQWYINCEKFAQSDGVIDVSEHNIMLLFTFLAQLTLYIMIWVWAGVYSMYHTIIITIISNLHWNQQRTEKITDLRNSS